MPAHDPPRRIRLRLRPAEAMGGVAPAPAGLSAARRLALIALLAGVVALVVAPVLVAGVSLVDAPLVDEATAWLPGAGGLAPNVALWAAASFVALIGVFWRSRAVT